MSSSRRITVDCPNCGLPVAWTSDSPFRPFCSERCRLVDLGEWLDGGRAIPGEDDDDPAAPESETP